MLADYRITTKTGMIKTVWYWHKDKHINQWKKIESSEINSHIYGQMIFYMGAPRLFNGERTLFSTNRAGNTRIYMQKMKSDSYFTPYINTKIDQRPKYELKLYNI